MDRNSTNLTQNTETSFEAQQAQKIESYQLPREKWEPYLRLLQSSKELNIGSKRSKVKNEQLGSMQEGFLKKMKEGYLNLKKREESSKS